MSYIYILLVYLVHSCSSNFSDWQFLVEEKISSKTWFLRSLLLEMSAIELRTFGMQRTNFTKTESQLLLFAAL